MKFTSLPFFIQMAFIERGMTYRHRWGGTRFNWSVYQWKFRGVAPLWTLVKLSVLDWWQREPSNAKS